MTHSVPPESARKAREFLAPIEQILWPLWVLAIAVLALVAVRAVVQSITIDEGDTYVWWVSGKVHQPWSPHSNNHLLNTYLIWIFVHLFGLSNVSMRLPSFIGAVLYVSACYRLCLTFAHRLSLRLPLLACLTVNPFVLDFLVAARGYSLALGFYTTALVWMSELVVNSAGSRRKVLTRFTLISVFCGLSFVANFSFALVIAISFGLFLLTWAAIQFRQRSKRFYLEVALAAFLPGALVASILAGWTILHWPRGQLVVGATSLREMWDTFLLYTFSDLSPNIIGPYLMRTFRHWRKALPWPLITLCMLELMYIAAARQRWRDRLEANRAALVCAYLGAVVILTVLVHWLAFHYMGLLMPKDRTLIFFLPLCLMIVGIAAGFPRRDFFTSLLRWATVAILIVGSIYFVGCIRLRYFLPWRYDADMEETYRQLVQIVGPGHLADVPSEFQCTSALNYYREYFHDNSFAPFALYDNPERTVYTHYAGYPTDRSVYVLLFPEDESFAVQQHLKTVYRGAVSNDVIAVRQ